MRSFLLVVLLWGSAVAAPPQKAIVIVPVADLRSTRTLADPKKSDDKQQTQLLAGETVEVVKVEGKWAYVNAIEQPEFSTHQKWEGYPGWVLKSSLKMTTSPRPPLAPPQDPVLFAETLLGTTYYWGGLNPHGIDCSGLTHLAYRMNHKIIPRDSHEQWMQARVVQPKDLQPGDLIFTAKAENAMKVTHVAMYIGKGMIIEAPQTGMVVRKISFADKYGGAYGEHIIRRTSMAVSSISGAIVLSVLKIQSIQILPVSFKLKTPFITAAGHKSETHNVQIVLKLEDGTRGIAEASSSLAMPRESQENLNNALRHLIPELRGRCIEDYRELVAAIWRLEALHPTAAAAMECAVMDAYTRTLKQSMATYFGAKLKEVESDLTLSVAEPPVLFRRAKQAFQKGFRRLKVKVTGVSAELDAARMAAVHKAAPRAQLVADGNQGFHLSQATEFVHLLKRAQIPIAF